jgi:hypothetical protein
MKIHGGKKTSKTRKPAATTTGWRGPRGAWRGGLGTWRSELSAQRLGPYLLTGAFDGRILGDISWDLAFDIMEGIQKNI